MPNEKAKCGNCRRKKIRCLPEGKAEHESCDRCQQSGLLCGPAVLASGASATSIVNRARSTAVEYPGIQYEWQPYRIEAETEDDHLRDVFTSSSQALHESEYQTPPSTMMLAGMNILGGETSFDWDSQLSLYPNNGYEQEGIVFMDQDVRSLSADYALAAQAFPSCPPTFYGPIPPFHILDARAKEQQMSLASIETFLSLPMSPSEASGHTAVTYRLVSRMNRLWGNAQTFQKNPRISELFARTIAEFFRNTCQLYASAYVMVRDAWYACIASDAMMNNTLSEPVMQAVSKFYVEHYYKAWNAIDSAWQRIREHGNTGDIDVTQLYFAVFLTFSSIACVRGRRDSIQEAKTIFNRLEQLGAAFPIGIDDEGGSDKNWTVRMFLTKDPQDPGMMIRYSSFFLAHERHEVDRSDDSS